MGPKKEKGKKGEGKKGKKAKKAKPVAATQDVYYWNKKPPVPLNAYYNRKWHEIQSEINRLLAEENSMFFNKKGKPKDPKPIKSREKAFQLCVVRYLRYILIARNLDECYTYMVHPQKRILVKKCMAGILTRILELKELMIDVEEREFHFFDDVLQDLQLTPDEVEMTIPRYFRDERTIVLQNRELILESIVKKIEGGVEPRKQEVEMTREQAILLIQRHQRAYMGRLKYYEKACWLSQKKNNYELLRKTANTWACYVFKCKTRRMRQEEQQSLGMMSYPGKSIAEPKKQRQEHIERNKRKIEDNMMDYELELAEWEDKILADEGQNMAENLKYNIIQWLLETKNAIGVFPEFPTEEMGGSNYLFSNKTVKQVEQELIEMFEDSKNKKPVAKKADKKPADKKGKKEEEEGYQWIMPKSQMLTTLSEEKDEYMKYWYYKDDMHNIHQKHDSELLKEAIRMNIAEKIRLEVDKLMRFEIENMKIAIEKAVQAKTKKKGKKKKGGKGKKKGGRKKKEKDLTKDRTMDDLYEELVQNEVIKRVSPTQLSDFLGDYSYTGSSTQDSDLNPLPSLADVRRLITEFAILPLGSAEVHQYSPLNRSLLIAGLRGTGKKMLVQAICHEAGANLFDITPSNLVGKYDSKEGMKMIMHLIMKVGKALEPSVFWINQCEDLYLKKKNKNDRAKPHKWAKILNKTLKKIKNGDRMMLIGTTRRPSLCKQKPLSKAFRRTVVVPLPDYGSRYMIWQHFIGTMAGLSHFELENMDFSSLTKVTTGFTMQAIKEACQEVITEDRLNKMRTKGRALTPLEFVVKIAAHDPIYMQEHEDFVSWFNNTPLAKRRMERLTTGDETSSKKSSKSSKKGGKKKGKKKK